MSLYYAISTIVLYCSISTAIEDSHIRRRLYISKNGRDRKSCGYTIDTACGTLYYTSSLLPMQNNIYVELYVHDGQNKNNIRKYLTNNQNNTNPCLPGTDLSGQWYDILTFNPNHIRTMNDWFSDFCKRITTNVQTKSFFPRYHYYSSRSIQMTINNLIINDFNFNDTNLITSTWTKINNLTMINVTTSGLLIDSSNIYVYNMNINKLRITNGSFIQNTLGSVGIYSSIISNLYMVDAAFIDYQQSNLAYNDWDHHFVEIKDSIFNNVYSHAWSVLILNQYNYLLNIENTQFLNIFNGSIIESYSYYDATSAHTYNIYMNGVHITTNQLQVTLNEERNAALIYIDDFTNVDILNSKFDCLYDVYSNCRYLWQQSNYTFNNADIIKIECYNPITLIDTASITYINDSRFSVNITNEIMNDFRMFISQRYGLNQNSGVFFEYESSKEGLIINRKQIYLYNTTIDGITYHYSFLSNPNMYGDLYLDNFMVNDYANYDPNDLKSYYIVNTPGKYLFIHNSKIQYASNSIIHNEIHTPTEYQFYKSSFLHTGRLIYIWPDDVIHIDTCYFTQFGLHYSNIYFNCFECYHYFIDSFKRHSNSISITNSVFDSFNPGGIIKINGNAELLNNSFNESSSEHTIQTTTHSYKPAIISLYNSTVCISGNIFTNYAFEITDSNLTNCKRNLMQHFSKQYEANNYLGCPNNFDYGHVADGVNNIFYFNNYNSPLFTMTTNSAILLSEVDFVLEHSANDNNIYIISTLNGQNNNLLLIDASFSHPNIDILYDKNNCKVKCNQLLNSETETETLFISQVLIECDDSDYATDASYVNNNNNSNNNAYTTFVDSLSPKYISFDERNKYFPNGILHLNYNITDRYYNHVTMNSNSAHFMQDITIILQSMLSNRTIILQEISLSLETSCAECINGLYLPSITLQNLNETVLIQTSVQNNLLISNDILLQIIDCPSGWGRSLNNYQCESCPHGQFNIDTTVSNSDNTCSVCNQQDNIGVTCTGRDSIIVAHNYWLGFAVNTGDIISGSCPVNYCCQLIDGCNFIKDVAYSCAANRDLNSFLCGACIDGFAEVLGTPKCKKCEKNYFQRLWFPILYGVILSFFILLSKSTPIQNVVYIGDIDDRQCCEQSQSLEIHGILFSKVLVYYYQSVAYILTMTGTQNMLYGLVQMYNLNIFALSFYSGSDDGYCLFKNMSALQKIIVQLTTTVSIIVFILVPYLLSAKCNINMFDCMERKTNFPQALVTAMLICAGQGFAVLFQLLSCQSIGDESVHYFLGAYQCYGWIWITSVILLFFTFALFYFIFAGGRKAPTDIEDTHYYMPFIKSYKTKYWYWELILFIRRSLLAFVFIALHNIEIKLCAAILLIIYLFVHWHCLPFKSNEVNTLESHTIACIIIIILIDMNKLESILRDISISIFILYPICWYLYFVIFKSFTCDREINATEIDVNESDDNAEEFGGVSVELVPPPVPVDSIHMESNEVPVDSIQLSVQREM